MGLLHKLWDETLAGPTPESGLGKLRKYDSFSATRSSSSTAPTVVDHDPVVITRSITIVRTNSAFSKNLSIDAPNSPAASSTPGTPLTPGTPAADFKRFTRRKTFDDQAVHEPRSPTVYDWIVISALDR